MVSSGMFKDAHECSERRCYVHNGKPRTFCEVGQVVQEDVPYPSKEQTTSKPVTERIEATMQVGFLSAVRGP